MQFLCDGLQDSIAKYAAERKELHSRLAAMEEENGRLIYMLKELYATVRGECPSLLNEDSGGNARLDMEITAAIKEGKNGRPCDKD